MRLNDNMKCVARKMKKLFNSKGHGNSDADCPKADSSDVQQVPAKNHTTRRQRKLPLLPKRQTMFTPTYRKAIAFLGQNKDTLDLAIDLVDIYPSLIHRDACTKLRQYVTKQKGHMKNEKYTEIEKRAKSPQHIPKSCREVLPEILVSEATDGLLIGNDSGCRKQITLGSNRICVCGDVDSEKWQKLLVNFCCNYSVTCVPVDKDSSPQQTDVDIFVFLLDSKSFDSEKCHQTLRQAYLSNTNVVYIRDMEFELSSTECISPTRICSFNEASDLLSLDRLLRSPEVNSLPTMSPLHENHGSKSPTLSTGRNIYLSRSVDSGLGRSGCSSRNSSFSPSKSPNFLDTDDPKVMFEPDVNRTTMTDDERIKLSRIINSEYASALTYHYLYHDTCVQRIHSALQGKLLPISISPLKQLHRPPSVVSIPDSAIDISLPNTPEPKQRVNSAPSKSDFVKRRRSVTFFDEKSVLRRGSIPTDTVYVITDPTSESPVIVHWPKDMTKNSMSNSPSIDSFGFQEVDLSKQVNELNLFDDSEFE